MRVGILLKLRARPRHLPTMRAVRLRSCPGQLPLRRRSGQTGLTQGGTIRFHLWPLSGSLLGGSGRVCIRSRFLLAALPGVPTSDWTAPPPRSLSSLEGASRGGGARSPGFLSERAGPLSGAEARERGCAAGCGGRERGGRAGGRTARAAGRQLAARGPREPRASPSRRRPRPADTEPAAGAPSPPPPSCQPRPPHKERGGGGGGGAGWLARAPQRPGRGDNAAGGTPRPASGGAGKSLRLLRGLGRSRAAAGGAGFGTGPASSGACAAGGVRREPLILFFGAGGENKFECGRARGAGVPLSRGR